MVAAPAPQPAAHALVHRLHGRAALSRDGWLVVGIGLSVPSRIRVFRWTDGAWQQRASLRVPGPAQWIHTARLTGSRDPDFVIQGCGAADTICTSVVSDVGGRWHAVPFEYGYGRATMVNGTPSRKLMITEVDACSCAGGPSTWMYERYQRGAFRPFDPHPLACSSDELTRLADGWEVQVLAFDRVACAGGWAIAVGSGAGFNGRAVALFVRAFSKRRPWELLTIDDGAAVPTWPAIYDLPLSLLAQLAPRVGLRRELAATRLVARLTQAWGFYWPQQNGIVGGRYLFAVLPLQRRHRGANEFAVRAVVYRWSGRAWVGDGRIPHLPYSLNVDWQGGWFTRSNDGFVLTATDVPRRARFMLTRAGGRWHVAKR